MKILENSCDKFSNLNKLDLKEALNLINEYPLYLRKSLRLPDNLTFGMEIEFEDALYSEVLSRLNQMMFIENDNYWGLEEEVTTKSSDKFGNYYGGEVKSPIFRDKQEAWLELKQICRMLEGSNATTLNRAGGHIHIGAQILKIEQEYWLKLLKFWIIYEKIFFRFSYGDKIGPRKNIKIYAPVIANTLYNQILEKGENINYKEILPKLRNQAINFNHISSTSFEAYNTIEFRCPNGTLNPIVWQNNVNVFSKFLLYCKSNCFNEELINYRYNHFDKDKINLKSYQEIYLTEALEFSDMIFDNNLDKLFFLKQYLKGFQQVKISRERIKEFKL